MDIQKIKHFRNTRSTYCVKHGIYLEELSKGHAKVTKTVTADDLNPLQYAHGGVYYAVADTACGSAVISHGHMVVTVSGSYNYFRSAKEGDTIICEAHEVKHGKTICVSECTIKDQNEVLLGNGSFTFYQLEQLVPDIQEE
ncbi:MAG: PaaI family thioesterase [Oscillibacter sp.]|nr:PaaI family thioesterase [Oscillibacter sp.]